MAAIRYKDLKRWNGKEADNVRCGLVRYGGKRILGCGKHTRTKGYYYKNKGGSISTVFLCPSCAKKVNKAKRG